MSQLGDQAFSLAMAFWVAEKTGSASIMGLLLTVGGLPVVLLGPLGGVVADRFPRAGIIIVCNLVGGAALLGLSLVMLGGHTKVRTILALLFGVAALLGAMRAFFQPAIVAFTPDLVPPTRLAAANSLNLFALQGSILLGQAVGGLLYQRMGAPLLFLFDGASFCYAAGSAALIAKAASGEAGRAAPRRGWARFMADLRDGLRYVRRTRGLLGLVLAATGFNFFLMPILVLLPFYVRRYLGAGAGRYGLLVASVSAGSILGFLIAGVWKIQGKARSWTVLLTLLLAAVPLAAIGFVRHPVGALATAAALGLMLGLFNVSMMTIVQTTTPSALRGRVLGLITTLTAALMPLGMAAGGIAGDLTGKNIPLIYASCGAFSFVYSLLAMGRRSTLDFMAQDRPPAVPEPAAEEGAQAPGLR